MELYICGQLNGFRTADFGRRQFDLTLGPQRLSTLDRPGGREFGTVLTNDGFQARLPFSARWMDTASGDQKIIRTSRQCIPPRWPHCSPGFAQPSLDIERATKFAPTWTRQSGKQRKTLLFRHFLVSKIASTWASHGGKRVIRSLSIPRRFPNPSPSDNFAFVSCCHEKKSKRRIFKIQVKVSLHYSPRLRVGLTFHGAHEKNHLTT